MAIRKHCPECDGTNLFARDGIAAKGGYGPDLLPGTSGLFTSAKMKAVVCRDCGFVRFYAAQDALAKVDTDHGWQRLP